MPIPEFNSEGDLPEGVHRATLVELLDRFGNRTDLRQRATDALLLVLNLAVATACLDRLVVFGSYITAKAEPNDVDLFLVMSAQFEIDNQTGDTREMFTHRRAQRSFNASVFWVNRQSSFASIDYLIEGWQTKRDRSRRGIVEVVL